MLNADICCTVDNKNKYNTKYVGKSIYSRLFYSIGKFKLPFFFGGEGGFAFFVLGRTLILAFNKKCAKIIDSATYILRRIVIG